MKELSLFSGAGGGLLGTHHLLGWEAVGYVEWNDYCQRVIAARIKDGLLNEAPIFGNIRTFLSDGYAAAYTGMVDVITAGFPCQPFSVAGKRAGANDNRNMWPETIATIRTVQPRFVFLENVPGLVTSGYFGTILGDLAESGFDCRWRILSASEMGAPHKRDRLWIVAHAQSKQNRGLQQSRVSPHVGTGSENVENTVGYRWRAGRDSNRKHGQHELDTTGEHSAQVAHAQSARNDRSEQGESSAKRSGQPGNGSNQTYDTNTIQQRLEREQQSGSASRTVDRSGNGSNSTWWQAEPDVGRVVNGLPSRVDRLKALGNGQVPAVAAAAWRILTGTSDR